MKFIDTQPLPAHLNKRSLAIDADLGGLFITLSNGDSFNSYRMAFGNEQFARICRMYLRECEAMKVKKQSEVEA